MSSEGYAIKVTGIEEERSVHNKETDKVVTVKTTEKDLEEFFGFCGTIKSIHYEQKKGEARIVFEKHAAAQTSLMLEDGTLKDSVTPLHIQAEFKDESAEASTSHSGGHDTPIDQTEKPKAAIVAEYLANAYVLKDHILERAIRIDKQQGISARFLSYLKSADSIVGSKVLGPDQTVSEKVTSTVSNVATTATAQAKKIDEQRGISTVTQEYFSKALASPWGRKVFDFYSTTTKQVQDIHEEANRIREHKKSTTIVEEKAEVLTT